MGKLWRKKSSVVESVADRRSSEAASAAGAGGGLKIHNEQIQSKFVSGSGNTNFYSSDQSYAGHISGSIKQLLSYEMSTENEQKRRAPSIIARLMGFEGLSPPDPTHKHRPNNQIKSQLRNSENCSQIRTPKLQHQQFKDVYEVSESMQDENQRYQSRRIATSDISEAEMAFLRQRFTNAKRLATSETFQGSKEFNDALEVLHKDLFLKLLQEPEPISAKNPHNLGRANPSPGRRTISEESVSNHRNKDMSVKFRRESLRNFDNGTSQKRSSNHGNSKRWLDSSEDKSGFPTKIVVLKPNIQKIQISEPESDVYSCVSEFESSKKVHKIRFPSPEHQAKKQFGDGLRLPKHNTGESRELAKRITRKMRCRLHSASLDFSHYNGDGSSSCETENDSSYGSDHTSFRRHNTDRNRAALSHYTGSSVNKEAKKRLSERWKMTHRFQEVGLSKRSTLGEMLSVPENRKESKIVILAGKGSTKDHRLYNSDEKAWPLGISSRDGWKYGPDKSLSRSTSVPARNSRGIFESPVRRKLSIDDRHPMLEMSLKDSRKSIKEKHHHNIGLNNRNRRSKSERLHSNIAQKNVSDECLVSEINDDLVHDEIPRDKEIIVPETSAELIINEVQDAQQDSLAMPSIPLEKHDLSRSVCHLEIQSPQHDNISDKNCEDYATTSNLLSFSPESPCRSKDAELPSPMSVLGVPFLDELSSGTECFGSLSADLQGLRMQLQLLKQESGSYAEGSIDISSSDDDDDDESLGVFEKRSLVAVDSLDSSYIIDALTNIGFYDTDPFTFMAKWHSPDHPMNPAEFEKLEEKYGEQTIWSRSERRILFDLINSGLVEIFKLYHDPYPWVKQSFFLSASSENQNTEGIEEKLLNWLQVQITQESDGTALEKTAVKELEWYDSAHYIYQVGTEVEDLLTDELIAEVFDSWCW